MPLLLNSNPAPGGPGIPPRWTRSDKDGVGTAYSNLSRVWFTVSQGILNEVYYPTIDRPQIRDLQFLVSDGETFFHDSRRDMESTYEYVSPEALGFRTVSTDFQRRYRIIKEMIADAHQPCVLMRTTIEAEPGMLERLRVYALMAPHLDGSGTGNNAHVIRTEWGDMLAANRGDTWTVLAATVPFSRCSCGYVGVNDGWQQLAQTYDLPNLYDCALNGNVALTGELDLSKKQTFLLVLGFGRTLHQALSVVSQSAACSFDQHRERFIDQWKRAKNHADSNPELVTGDGGSLFRMSRSLIQAHEDKTYVGAIIASLSIPWGDAKGDDLGGYHLVWTRDMYQSATGLLAAGVHSTPLRALIYLACTQRQDGGFYQNFWIDGEPYWRGIQLDETAFPIMLAWRLHQQGCVQQFDIWPMVRRAASFLIHNGPITAQERWEENSGYSPSTLAANITALICAAEIARQKGYLEDATYLEEYADFLEQHLEQWTVTTEGGLVPGITRHYIRIHPADFYDTTPNEDANTGEIEIKNLRTGLKNVFPARDVVDAGFLELVRYGIRAPDDPIVLDTLKVIDAVLRIELPQGPCWYRYNHDGYGQRDDGGPFLGAGRGRPWPLLTGERGHYELAAGNDARDYLHTIERYASQMGLIPEQVWDVEDMPEASMYMGRPTGGAMPLVWAHAEYLKLARSIADGKVFDEFAPVVARYQNRDRVRQPIEVWKFNRQIQAVAPGTKLRVQAAAPFQLRWSLDGWQTPESTKSSHSSVGVDFVDFEIPHSQQAPLQFTFYWPGASRWEGRDYTVQMTPPGG